MDPTNSIIGGIDWLERTTDSIGRNMKALIFIALIVLSFIYWNELSAFVSGHAAVANTNITKWLVENTPKK